MSTIKKRPNLRGGASMPDLNPAPVLPHAALRDGRKSDALNILLADPDSLHAYDDSRQTPLHIAADKGFEDMVALFLQRGAKVNAIDTNGGWTPLHRYHSHWQLHGSIIE